MKISVWKCVGSTLPACSPLPPLPRKVAQMVQYIADMLKKLLSLKLAHRLCIVPLGTSCNKILFHKSSILAVKMTIYWISYEVQKESQENLWPIANYFNFFLLKASVFKNSSKKKCTKRYNTDLIRVKKFGKIQSFYFPTVHNEIWRQKSSLASYGLTNI